MRAAKTLSAGRAWAGDGGAAGARFAGGARSAGALRLRAAGDLLPADSARALRGARPAVRRRAGGAAQDRAPRCSHELDDMAALASPDLKDTALTMARGDWPWGAEVLAALGIGEPAKKPRPARGPRCLAPAAQLGGAAARHAARQRSRSSRARRACGSRRWSRPAPTSPRRGRPRATTPRPPPTPSRRARERTSPRWCWPRPAPASARPWAISRPASLWAEANGAPVWVSTYTRALQRQIDSELDRLHRDSAEKRRRVVIRKGRENYLCLLNFQEAVDAHRAACPRTPSASACWRAGRWPAATAT